MNTREQFGKYLLLKKLTEDPLGETFRAGMLGSKGMERVALLRVFNGQGVDGQRLWQATEGRAAVQQLLRSPNIGEGIEMGQIEGIPYVAYDYVSGKNMATLLEQAAKKRNFIPTEHALLITERIALALAVACESRHDNDRILHGFVTPHLVMISNEGETRLLGFEVSSGLRGFASNPVIRQHFGRYLAPEALNGAPPDKSDDIYSLGVVLFELLTGKPLPPPAADGFGSVIDRGTLATEGAPIPADLASLLKQSLVPRDQRIGDAAAWHKALNKWMFDGQYNPTTFNLAFYMHNLFRQEIEKESQEIEVEKTLPLPVVDAPSTESAAAPETPTVDEPTENFIPEYAKDEKKSKAGLFAGIGVAAALALGAGLYFTVGGGGGAATEEVATEPAEQVAPPPPPEPTGPTPEELRAQIAELVNEESKSLEADIRSQYDEQLAKLRSQLSDAEKANAERKAEEERLAKEAEEEAARLVAEEEAARVAAEEEAARVAAEEEAARVAAAEAAAKKAEEEEAARLAAAAPPPAAAPKQTDAPAVRRGDLVKPGPGVVPPQVVRRVAPRYPEMARRLKKQGAVVTVRVLVDETGKVVTAELTGKKAGFGFDSEALSAAKKATYKPATKNGVPVKIWHTLSISFQGN